MAIHFTPLSPMIIRCGRRLLIAVMLAFFIVTAAPTGFHASAIAPPLATAVLDAAALAAPDHDAAQIAVIPQGAEIELTGEAAPGFLAVYYDGQVVWVPARHLSLGSQAGIDTAVTIEDTPLLDAPMIEAAVLEIIQEGQAVILTGASVDGYEAASHDGTGGWILDQALSQ